MRLVIATDNPGVSLPKVVVSVFPGHPDRGRVTIDVEIVSTSVDSITLEVDDETANFTGMTRQGPLISPYENPGKALPVYLGEEYGRVGDHVHRDRTGDEDHFVIHSDAELTELDAASGCAKRRLALRPLVRTVQPNHIGTRQVILAKGGETVDVNGRSTLGGWVRIVLNWPVGLRDGLVDRFDTSVRLNRLDCGGLYVWMFAPRYYQFESTDCEVTADGGDPDVRRVRREKVQEPAFVEFPLWKGMIVGKEGVRNAKRITCKTAVQVDFRATVSSGQLRLQARRKGFLVGVGVALSASAIIQALWGLIYPVDQRLIAGFLLVSCIVLVWLVRYGFQEPWAK